MLRSHSTICLYSILVGLVLPAVGLAQEVVKLSRAEATHAVVNKIAPEYPAMARQLKMAGEVEVEAVVTETGQVEAVNIISGNPVLTHAVVEAVRKWKFTPQTLGGKPARAFAPLSFTFKP